MVSGQTRLTNPHDIVPAVAAFVGEALESRIKLTLYNQQQREIEYLTRQRDELRQQLPLHSEAAFRAGYEAGAGDYGQNDLEAENATLRSVQDGDEAMLKCVVSQNAALRDRLIDEHQERELDVQRLTAQLEAIRTQLAVVDTSPLDAIRDLQTDMNAYVAEALEARGKVCGTCREQVVRQDDPEPICGLTMEGSPCYFYCKVFGNTCGAFAPKEDK